VAEGDFHAGSILAACRHSLAAGAAKTPRPLPHWGGFLAATRRIRYQPSAFSLVAGLTGTPVAAAALIRD
jgi:hypothetical protein